MTQPLLQLKGLYKSFGEKSVLNGIDIDVAPGKSLVIMGGSGSGKSVMLKCALGLLSPDEGEIIFDGQTITEKTTEQLDDMRRRTGMLFQGGALFDSLPVWQNIAFRLIHAKGVSKRDARDQAVIALRKVRLGEDVADLYPSELSGGMQKRVSLARTIVTSPELIFFDEPTTGLDPITADAINDLILEQTRTLGAASVTITHDMASARKVADEMAMIFDGKIIWRGPADTIDDSGNEYVDQFINGRAQGPIKPAM